MSQAGIFPAAGVEVGETCLESSCFELEEEAQIAVEGPPALAASANTQTSRRDHVATTSSATACWGTAAHWEIAEARFPRLALRKRRHGRLGRKSLRSSLRRSRTMVGSEADETGLPPPITLLG